jgi:hypothetical protein
MSDPRIVYGASCCWWDSIDRVGHLPGPFGRSLPCCPRCNGVLFEMTDEAEWWRSVDRHMAVAVDPKYRSFIEWLRGRCFQTIEDARAEYDRRERE